MDVTVISTLQQSTVRGSAKNQGHALLVAEKRKFPSYGATCQAVGITFIPLVIESLGGVSDMADTISSLGRLLGQRLGISPVESTRLLYQKLAISLWRGNASAWIHRCPQLTPSLDSVFSNACLCCFVYSFFFPVFFCYLFFVPIVRIVCSFSYFFSLKEKK